MSAERTAPAGVDASPQVVTVGGKAGDAAGKGVVRARFDAAKNAVIDNAMGKGDSWAKGVGAHNQGVLLDDIQRFLAALALKVVDVSRICITPEQLEEYEAYKVIAKRHLTPATPKLDQDFDQ